MPSRKAKHTDAQARVTGVTSYTLGRSEAHAIAIKKDVQAAGVLADERKLFA